MTTKPTMNLKQTFFPGSRRLAGKKHTAEWAKATYAHEHFVTLAQLPKWKIAK